MSKLRSLNTAFWSDTWVEDLEPLKKLLFIYLVTNDKTNMLGIYESSIRKISFETGIDGNLVKSFLSDFEKDGKVRYKENRIILINYMKHQNYNTNMKKSAIDVYNNLPECLRVNNLNISKSNPSEGFERLSNAYGMVRKVEVEYEVEEEIEEEIEKECEVEEENTLHNIDILKNYYLSKDRILNAVVNNKRNNLKNLDDLKFKLDLFCEDLKEQGRLSEKWTEFTRYFLNVLKTNKYKDLDLSFKRNENPNNEEIIKFHSNVDPTPRKLLKSRFLDMQRKNKDGGYIYTILN